MVLLFAYLYDSTARAVTISSTGALVPKWESHFLLKFSDFRFFYGGQALIRSAILYAGLGLHL